MSSGKDGWERDPSVVHGRGNGLEAGISLVWGFQHEERTATDAESHMFVPKLKTLRRAWQPFHILCTGESYEQRNPVGCSP